MSIDIKVEGKPDSVRQVAGWMRDMSSAVDGCATSVQGASSSSESGWGGDAGPAFREAMRGVGNAIDDVGESFGSGADKLENYADDIDTVKSKMGEAKQVALDGGLTVADDKIHDPGKAPAAPGKLPDDATPAEKSEHEEASAAQDAYATKVDAYQEASEIVSAARKTEGKAETKLITFASGQVEKAPFTITDFATGIAGAVAARTSGLRTVASSLAARVNDMYKLTDTGPRNATWLKNAMKQAELAAEAKTTAASATAGRVSKFVDRLPNGVKSALQWNAGSVVPKGATGALAKGARSVLSKVPVVGLAVTAAGIGYDIHSGKDPTKAVASGVGSFAAGAAVGACIGGPVGVVVGGVVGIGVGYVIDEWGDEIAEGVGDAADAVGDFVGGLF